VKRSVTTPAGFPGKPLSGNLNHTASARLFRRKKRGFPPGGIYLGNSPKEPRANVDKEHNRRQCRKEATGITHRKNRVIFKEEYYESRNQ